MFTKTTKIFLLLIAMLAALTFTACGGGDGGGGGGSAVSGGGGGGGGGGNSTPKAWGQPTLLETEAGIAGAPAVAADRLNNSSNDGLVIAVWSQSDGVQDSIYATRYSGSWSSPVTIENESTGGFAGGAYSPRIAMGDHGEALVVWGYTDGSNRYYIWSNRYDAGWTTAEWINDDLREGNANSPQLAYDTSGLNVFTVWSQFDQLQNDYRITQKQYYYAACAPVPCFVDTNDFYWRSASTVDINNIGDASEQQIAAWGTRNAVAVWTQNNVAGSVGNEIWANVATNGTWGTAVRVNTGSLYGAAAPMVAVDGSGNAFAVWFEWAGRKTLYASRYSVNTATWSAPVQIDDPVGSNASDYDPPRHAVVIDANGNALIIWQQENADQTEYNIYARRCPAGNLSGCQSPVLIENSAGYADLPALALAPNGDAIAVWKQEDGSARRIYANHYSASGNSWDANPSLVGGADSTWNEGPQIAIDGNSNATVVWTEYEAGQYNIRANRFE